MSGAMIAGLIGDLANNIWGNINQSISVGQQQQFMQQQEKLAQQQLDLAEREYYSNVDIMNKNFGLQQAAFDYNKNQAELTRMREDNAFQRRVADTVKAGFSPLATEGVASSSQAPTLTAPQLDPQGVNQATSNRLNAYNAKMQNNNVSQQLRLQSQQLKLAQIETLTETIAAVQNLRSQNIINQRNMHELNWYREHGYRDTTLNTILSDILKGVNYKGKSIGQLGADGVNYALDKILNDPSNVKKFGTGTAALLGASFANNVKKTGGLKHSDNNPLKQNSNLSKRQIRGLMNSFESNWFTKSSRKPTQGLGKGDINQLYRIADILSWRGPYDILPDGTKKISDNQWFELKNSYYEHLEELSRQGWL